MTSVCHAVGFAQAHDGAIAVAFEDIADGFIEHSTLWHHPHFDSGW